MDESGAPLLIGPTEEDPREHLALSPRTGKYQSRTHGGQKSHKGQVSIEVFGLGRDILEKGRQDAWHTIPALLLRYGAACARADWSLALDVQRTLCRFPFASVFVWFLDLASRPETTRLSDPHGLDVLARYPDIHGGL